MLCYIKECYKSVSEEKHKDYIYSHMSPIGGQLQNFGFVFLMKVGQA